MLWRPLPTEYLMLQIIDVALRALAWVAAAVYLVRSLDILIWLYGCTWKRWRRRVMKKRPSLVSSAPAC